MDKGFATLIGMSIAYIASFLGMGLAYWAWRRGHRDSADDGAATAPGEERRP